MAQVEQSDDSSNNASSVFLEMDEFLPIVAVKDADSYDVDDEEFTNSYLEDDAEDLVEFPEFEDTENSESQVLLIRSKKQVLVLPFEVENGTENSWEGEGFLTVEVSSDKDETVAVPGVTVQLKKKADEEYSENLCIEYDSEIDIEITVDDTVDTHTEFYIRFMANDDEDDYDDAEFENVFCGCIKVYFRHTTLVGLRLTSNIENLPLAPAGYTSPPTFSEPKKSFVVGNDYQNSGGMCYAVSMTRVRQAYQDEFSVDALSLNLKGQDYWYSATGLATIPDTYFGYGVGGALAANDYADLIDEDEIWDGDLEEGAMLQYWNNYNDVEVDVLLSAIRNALNTGFDANFDGGHSVVFKSYIRDDFGNITGLNYYDYSGTDGSYNNGGSKVFLGANLEDAN